MLKYNLQKKINSYTSNNSSNSKEDNQPGKTRQNVPKIIVSHPETNKLRAHTDEITETIENTGNITSTYQIQTAAVDVEHQAQTYLKTNQFLDPCIIKLQEVDFIPRSFVSMKHRKVYFVNSETKRLCCLNTEEGTMKPLQFDRILYNNKPRFFGVHPSSGKLYCIFQSGNGRSVIFSCVDTESGKYIPLFRIFTETIKCMAVNVDTHIYLLTSNFKRQFQVIIYDASGKILKTEPLELAHKHINICRKTGNVALSGGRNIQVTDLKFRELFKFRLPTLSQEQGTRAKLPLGPMGLFFDSDAKFDQVGNLIVSALSTNTIYWIDSTSGQCIRQFSIQNMKCPVLFVDYDNILIVFSHGSRSALNKLIYIKYLGSIQTRL